MKSIFTALVVLGLGVSALAGDGSELFAIQKSATLDQSSIYGYWAGKDQKSGDFVFGMRMKIEKSTMTVGARCDYQGKTTYAELAVPVVITADTIAVPNGGKAGDDNCNINLPAVPATPYQVHLGVLTVQGLPDSLDKLKDL